VKTLAFDYWKAAPGTAGETKTIDRLAVARSAARASAANGSWTQPVPLHTRMG
jgi:hypothetical protein